MLLHLVHKVELAADDVQVIEELVRRGHLDHAGPLQTEVVLITELQFSRQQRLSVLGPSALEQRVEVSEGLLGVELEQVHGGDGLDRGDDPGDAVGL